MKKFYALLVGLLSTSFIYSQIPDSPPQGFSYRAIITKANGANVANRTISLKVSILQGSTNGIPVYTEIFYPTTNEHGQIDIIVGENGLSSIQWDQGPFFLKTEVDEKGGTNFFTLSITQLLSVPYALYSGSSATTNETDPIFKAHDAYQYSAFLLEPGNTAFEWGNHAGLYRSSLWVPSWSDLTGKPSFALVALSGNYTDLINKPVVFDGAWASLTGKPSTIAGYGISDAMTTTHAANGVSSGMIDNWNTAYTWGNHAGLYRPLTWIPAWSDVTGKPGFSTVATSGSYNDLKDKPSLFECTWTSLAGKPSSISGYGITDAMSTAHDANLITSGLINNWNNSFAWGNHATAGYVPGIRTLTINGTALDLSADRSWDISTTGSSVALAMPEIFSVSGSPVTGTGTLTTTLVSQSPNLVFASPNEAEGTPTFRKLVQADIPSLNWHMILAGKPTTLAGYGIFDAVTLDTDQYIYGNKTFHETIIAGFGVNACNKHISYVATPISPKDAANKEYVDALESRIAILENQMASLLNLLADNDGDGYKINQDDCNDNDPAVHPGATELCDDGIDQDCNGQVDEGCPSENYTGNARYIQFGLISSVACGLPLGGFNAFTYAAISSDLYLQGGFCGSCIEVSGPKGNAMFMIVDRIGDGSATGDLDLSFEGLDLIGDAAQSLVPVSWRIVACEAASLDMDGDGFTEERGDCAENDPAINPGATEICNDNKDNNCNVEIDEGCSDSDNDGITIVQGDCNDYDPAVFPGAIEICGDKKDNNCNSQMDEGCPDFDGDGITVMQGDCNDNDPAIFPGAIEICGDNTDNNCNGTTDEGCVIDMDGDGFAVEQDCNDNDPQ